MPMKLDITCKMIELTNPLRAFVEEKIGSLDRGVPELKEGYAVVEIGKPSRHHKSGEVFYAEAMLKMGRATLRAESTHHDLRAAIVDVREALKAQLAKRKEKALARRTKKR
ncbi:MAG: ribosome-associated translation inhibitor RaiA [Candidatus Paceibacterota bacterium]|nr:MAG: ribosome-associated translation inhibitor RaiA [Candidatus Paceibacterota bacterium]